MHATGWLIVGVDGTHKTMVPRRLHDRTTDQADRRESRQLRLPWHDLSAIVAVDGLNLRRVVGEPPRELEFVFGLQRRATKDEEPEGVEGCCQCFVQWLRQLRPRRGEIDRAGREC